MISRVRAVSVPLFAALTIASVCLAADPVATPVDKPVVTPAPVAIGPQPGKGGIGGQIGLSSFRLDRTFGAAWFDDYSDAARARLVFNAHWRYQLKPWLRWQIGVGFAWAGYTEHSIAPFTDPNVPTETSKGDYLTLMLPVTAELHYMYRNGPWHYYGGLGPGVYRVWVENHRKVLKDPVSLKLHRGIYPGGSAELGVERFMKDSPNISLEATLAGHLALAQRPDQFPSGFNSNCMATEFRVGANYYFTPGPRKATATTAPKSP
jgi:hypothetical protein